MSDIMSDMKMKKVPAREFQKRFGKLSKELEDGQAVQVTNHGKPIGVFTKLAPIQVKTPDFLANMQTLDFDAKLGDKILEEFNASLS
jgi:antitoxin (DNA-binding transcriptional repressor) of toxin-antitoxin stability system